MLDALVVGGDSAIGREIAAGMLRHGRRVATTTRRADCVGDGRIQFDLLNPDPGVLPPARTVLIAAARAGAECERDPAGSAAVNVVGTVATVQRMAARGSRVVFLSTSQVFDGGEVPHAANKQRMPKNEYARQKAAVEDEVLALGKQGVVFRLSKVLSPTLPLLRDWSKRLAKGKSIDCFTDMTCSPISLAFAAGLVSCVIEEDGAGIYQASADSDVSWYEIGVELAAARRCPRDLVRPVSAKDVVPSQLIFNRTAMECSRLEREFGLRPPSAMATIATIASQVAQHYANEAPS